MNSVRRFDIVILLTIAGCCSLLLAEAKYHSSEDSSLHHHRHRHHREEDQLVAAAASSISLSNSRRSNNHHHRLAMRKHYLDQRDDDYENDAYDFYDKKRRRNKKRLDEDDDDDDEDNEDEDDEDFDYVEEKYPIRYGWRRSRARRVRYHYDYPRNRDVHSLDESEDENDEDEYDYNSKRHYRQPHRRFRHHQRSTHYYHKDNSVHRFRSNYGDSRSEAKAGSSKVNWLRKKFKHREYSNDDYSNIYQSNKSGWMSAAGGGVDDRKWRFNNNLRRDEDEDDDDDNDNSGEAISKQDDDEEEDIWSALADYDDTAGSHDDDDYGSINYDYFEDISDEDRSEEPPFKTYEEIIKRLTSDEPTTTTPLTSIKRDYRNTGIVKYLKQDAYGNLKYEMPVVNGSQAALSKANGTVKETVGASKSLTTTTTFGRKRFSQIQSNVQKIENKKPSNLGKTKSLDPDYPDDYGNDNGKRPENEDDGDEYDVYVQRNDTVSQVDYTSSPLEQEPETSAPPSTTTTTTTTTTTIKPTTPRPTITTTTTQKSLDRRSSNNTSISQQPTTNGLQSNRQRYQTKESKVQQPNQSRQKAEMREALRHAIKVSKEGSCQWPRARVIPVREVYPNPSTTYTPHCAILHRCSDDTGCCRSEALTCVPKHSHRVELYFYTTSINGGNFVEKLSFYNHTECECKEKSDYGMVTEVMRHHHSVTSPPPQNIRIPPQKKPCRCPSEFTPRIAPDGECQCKCFESDEECVRARRGKVFFSAKDRLCIQRQECAQPTCEFGEYIMRQGKCPRKKDKIDSIANSFKPSNGNHRQRS